MTNTADTPAMFPLMLDLTAATVFVVGAGESLEIRLKALAGYGVAGVFGFAKEPSAEVQRLAAGRWSSHWPEPADFERYRPRVVFIADVPDADASRWRDMAHAVGALVHVQDRIPLCDFHL